MPTITKAQSPGADQHRTTRSAMQRQRESSQRHPAPATAADRPRHYSSSLLTGSALRGRGNAPVQIALMREMQQTSGNRAVQRFLQRSSQAGTGPATVQRDTGKAQAKKPIKATGKGRKMGPKAMWDDFMEDLRKRKAKADMEKIKEAVAEGDLSKIPEDIVSWDSEGNIKYREEKKRHCHVSFQGRIRNPLRLCPDPWGEADIEMPLEERSPDVINAPGQQRQPMQRTHSDVTVQRYLRRTESASGAPATQQASRESAQPQMHTQGPAPVQRGIFSKIGKAIGGVAKGVSKVVGGVAKGVGDVVGGIAKGVSEGISAITGKIVQSVGSIKNKVTKGASKLFGGIKKVGGALAKGLKKVGGKVAKGAAKLLSGAKSLGGKVFGKLKGIGGKLKNGMSKLMGKLKGIGGKVFDKLKQVGARLFDSAKKLVNKYKQIKAKIQKKLKSYASKLKKGVLKLSGKLKSFGGKVVKGIRKIGGKLKKGVGKFFGKVKSFGSKMLNKAKKAAGGLFGKIVSGLKSLGSKIFGGIKSFGGKLLGGLKSFGSKVLGGAKKIFGKLKSFGSKVWGGIKKGFAKLKEFGGKVWGAIKKGAGKLWNGLKKVGGKLWNLAKLIGGKIKVGLEDIGKWAINLIRDLPGRLKRLALTLLDGMAGVITFLPRALMVLIKEGPKGLLKWLGEQAKEGAAWAGTLISRILDLVGGPEIAEFILHLIAGSTTPLTEEEIKAGQAVLGPGAIRWNDVRINEGGLYDLIFKINEDRHFTTFHTINVPKGHRADIAVMVHELTHVYQYEVAGSLYMGQAIHAQSTVGYGYGGPEGLQSDRLKGKRFRDYNREQQGQIAQDYYTLHFLRSVTTPEYDPFIGELKARQL